MGLPEILTSSNLTERSIQLMSLARERVLIFDGAMGTQIHSLDLADEAFGGIPDCPEMLNLHSPESLELIHSRFYRAGADIVETNSFGASTITLSEFGLQDRTHEINVISAQIARRVARRFSAENPDKPRFVSGSLGPGTKLPSLGHVAWDELTESLTVQVCGLLEGGIDVLQIETCQDIMQIKSAVVAARRAFERTKISVPIVIQMTVETSGTLLLGTEVQAAFATLENYPEIWGFGLNCGTGPTQMGPYLKTLASLTTKAIVCLPNAGLPANVNGQVVYPLSPEPFAEEVAAYVRDIGLNLVGGCCGSTPEHISALAKAVHGQAPKAREAVFEDSVASLYSAYTLSQQPAPLLVGERLNANGSRKFKKLLLAEDYDGMISMAKSQMKGGAHVLDVCVAYVGRDEVKDMRELLTRLRGQSQLPLVVDSTEVEVIEAALKLIPGRATVNSINLEDGEDRAVKVLKLCSTYGAAVIALTINEEGQAYTADGKVAIARRIFDLAVRHGLRPQDIIFDPLTFTLGTGEEIYRKVAVETLEGIRRIKVECPGSRTILGLSNCSFGLNPAARQVLNSVFLHEAVKSGLDQAIVHAAKIQPLYQIPEAEQTLARRLIFDDRTIDDPLMSFMALFQDRKATRGARSERPETIEEVLEHRIIDGDKKGLAEDLNTALEKYEALEIINRFLLDGMKIVGQLFGSGEMQLPFVLQSAEVMKTAVKHLEPHMEKLDRSTRGRIVLATVKGDVHDIGKNLVDIILSNNGFEVINLGIKQPIERIITAAQENKADIVGMSGLLVKSTVIMRDNLIELNRRGLTHFPIILGGAALTRSYVEEELRELYDGEVAYARDAFEGLRLVTRVAEQGKSLLDDATEAKAEKTKAVEVEVEVLDDDCSRRSKLAQVEPVTAPFWGPKKVERPFERPDQIFEWINKKTLFRGQWQFRRASRDAAQQAIFEQETVEPIYQQVRAEALEMGLLKPKVAYGFFPCRSENNDVVIYDDPSGSKEIARLSFPRQRPGKKDLCLADYFRADVMDCVGFSAVTVGEQAAEFTKELFAADEFTRYLYFHGLSVEAAEGLAEYWHQKMRAELGIDAGESRKTSDLFRQRYRGARYSFGYPACPDLGLQEVIFDLIPAKEVGISLTEECQLVPEQSTTAMVVHHPDARYFMV
jgi:5-methyltetrahydrofolate--homocysteine methyltransferase